MTDLVLPGRQRFTLAAPLPTHWRRATCKEVDCPRYVMGFTSVLDESVADLRNAADWIRHNSGMRFVERKDGAMTVFEFPAGQECFEGRASGHRIKTDKPEITSQTTTRGTRRFERGRDFNEAFNEEMYQIERLLERG